MSTKEKLTQYKFSIELLVAVILFAVALYMDKVVEFIIYMLYFIIFVEIVRTILSFIREQRVRLTPLIDAFIILALREFIVNVVKINTTQVHSFQDLFNSPINFHILVFSGVLIFLFILRFMSQKTSPDRYGKSKENHS